MGQAKKEKWRKIPLITSDFTTDHIKAAEMLARQNYERERDFVPALPRNNSVVHNAIIRGFLLLWKFSRTLGFSYSLKLLPDTYMLLNTYPYTSKTPCV